MSKRESDRGKRGEREVCAILRAAGYEVRRGWQSRQGSDDPDVVGIPGVWLEVGFGRTIKPRAKLAQAIEASAGRDVLPVAITRAASRDDWIVTMTLDDFVALVLPLIVERATGTAAYDAGRDACAGEGG